MFQKLLVTTCLSVVFLSFVLFYCKLPQPPAGPEEVRIDLSLRSSDGKTSGFEITDTVGNQPQIRVLLSLTHFIDSANIEILSGTTTEQTIPCRYKNAQIDTVFFPVSFSTAGTRTIKVTGFIKDYEDIVSTATIHILDRQPATQNQKPVLTVPGMQTVGVGQTVSFTVSATDPDPDQQVAIIVLKKPESATFASNVFKWTPAINDTGKVTVVFVASDNGTPVSSTTDSVSISVGATQVNRAPQWNSKTLQRAIKAGVPFSYNAGNNCSDSDNDSITYSLIIEPPAKDTIIGSIYSFTPAISDTGKHTVHIIAKDPKGLSDTLFLQLTITINDGTDNISPIIVFKSPSKDTIISADSFDVKVSIVDESGCSVKGFIDGKEFTLSNSTPELWTGKIKGLAAGTYSTIKITAIDSSKANNKDSLSLRIKFDNDKTGPAITLVKPATKTTSTNTSTYSIEMNYTDISGIKSVTGTSGTSSITGVRSGDNWIITANNLIIGTNSIIVTATDSSLQANKTLDTFSVKYDPTMNDAEGPTISQVSGPTSGAVFSDSNLTIIDTIFDPSGVDSIYWTINGGIAKQMSPVPGKTGQYSLSTILTKEHANTIVITAIDKSTQHNRNTQTIELNYIVAPKITAQPQSIKLCPGSTASVTVTATGTAPLKYQWRNSSGNIANATSSTYEINSLTTTTILTCILSNGATTTTTSNPCTLTVHPAVSVSVSPENAQGCNGIITTFTAAASGGSGFEYQWYKGASPNGTIVTGETAPSLKVTISDATAGDYYCVAKNNTGCSGISNGVTLTKNQAVTVNITSTSTAICSGESVTLTAVPTGGSSHTFQWYSGTQKVGTSSSQYIATAAGTYRCEATSSAGCMGSGQIVITSKTLSTAPTVRVKNSGSTSVCSGGSAELEIAGGTLGTNAVWKWYNNGTLTNNDGKTAITAYPTQTSTIYSVKGVGDCGEGPAGTITITLKTAPQKATGITANLSAVCTGSPVLLTVNGTLSGTNSKWVWYKDLVNSASKVGEGNSITPTITVTSTYIVRAEGDCGSSDTVKKQIIANPVPKGVLSISPQSSTYCDGQYVELLINNSEAGYDYRWFRNGVLTLSDTNRNVFEVSQATAGQYYCIITNNYGCRCTTNTVNIARGFQISKQPESGCTSSLIEAAWAEVEVIGNTGTLTYEWYCEGCSSPMVPPVRYFVINDNRIGYGAPVYGYSTSVYCKITDNGTGCVLQTNTITLKVEESCP